MRGTRTAFTGVRGVPVLTPEVFGLQNFHEAVLCGRTPFQLRSNGFDAPHWAPDEFRVFRTVCALVWGAVDLASIQIPR